MNNTPVNPYSHKDANQDFQQTVIPHPTESSQVLGKFDDRPMEQSDVAKQAIAGLPSSDELLTFDQQTDYEPVEKPIDYQPTKENAKYFSAVVANIGRLKENKEDDSMRKANILEGICAMSPQLKEMSEIDPDATLNVFFGVEKSKSIDAMEQVLTNINDSIEEDRENELLFNSMSDKDRRAFIELQYKDRLQTGIRIDDTLTGYQQTTTNYRKATDDEIKKWSGEYIDTLKYKQFWQARSLCGADNVRLAFALSTIESESGFETFKDDVGKLSDEEKFRVYIVARGLAKKKDYWNTVLSRWGEGWKSVGSFIADIATFKNFELNAIKFTQFVDENGGVDAVKNNPELLRKLFRTGDLGEFNTTTEEASGEKLAPLGVRYYAESESDAMSKVKKIYDAGKRQISARKTLREMQLALSDNYKSNGYIEDRIADGVFYALEAGQFALTAIGTGGVGFGIKVASATAKVGKMVSVAEKLATASKVAYKGANYSMYGHKLVMPYFYARMAHDAQQSAIDAGLDDTQAFMYGSAVGLINSYLEKIQFNLTLKNVFLGSKVVDLLANGKSALTQITLQHALQSAKRRATIFGQEYLIETLQNANDELGLFFSAKLADKEYVEFEEVMNRLTQQGKDMIIPLLVSTNIGAGRGNFVSDVAKGVKFKNDPSAFRRYMGAVHFNEAMTHLENSGIPNISEKDAFDFVDAQNDLDKAQADFENAETQEEKDKAQAVIDSAKATQDKILGNLDEKQRRQAEKSLMDFASETAKGVNEIIESVVEKVKSSSDAKALPAPVDHELNKRFIQDYAKWVGIQDDIIYLETLNDAGEDVIEMMKSKLRNEGKSENEINDILFGEKGIDGIRFNGKIYIVGGKTKSTSRTLEVLKHETGHRGAEKIRETAEYKTFLDKLLDSAGGEAIVREALSRAKGGAYDTYERYDLAEEFMCTLAEKVKGGNELTKEELSTWAKIVNFFVELLADIPENPKFRDRHIANLIRAIWKEEYLEDTPEAFDFEAESDLESSRNIVEKEASETQKKKAKQNFRMKILRMRLREKSLTDSEREELEEKIRIQEWLDTIPDENVAEKLEAISSVEDEDLLSDEILLYAVENGATWADEALTRRHNEQEEKELKKGTQSLLSIMESNNIKLPTPKAIRDYCKANGFSLSSTLHGEINDIYSGLKLDIRQKYFSKHYREIDSAFIDELNTELGFDYKDVSEFLQDFADNVWGVSESRFSFVGQKAQSDFVPEGYDKTLSSLLDDARKLFRNGTDIREIYLKTGWYLDDENVNNPKWKFEVQNPLYDFVELGVDKKLDKKESLFLNEIFPNDAPIFKVYPHFKNINVVKDYNESEASFSAKTNTINLAPFIWDGLYNVNKIFGGKGKLSKKQQDEAYGRQTRQNFLLQFTLEHELQHAIQEYEGFDRGSNPTAFFKILKMYLEYKNLINNISNIPDNIKIPIERFIKKVEEKFGITESDLLDGDVDDNLKAYAWSLYYNTKGEFEAFTTKYRLQQSEDERKQEAFFDTQDIVKSALKKNAKRNVNTIFDSYSDTINSLTEDVNDILSEVFRKYGHLQSNEKGYGRLSSNSEEIQNNASYISDFFRRISSSITSVSSKKVDTGFDRQELRGNSQGIRFSYNETRTQEELDELNKKFRDLYERYKNGDQEAYKQAVELAKAEAERKGYVVKVYHGTGADGFNVAKADSSEQQNGEGNQAHGAGLYMAVSRETAEKYRENASLDNPVVYTIGGKNLSDLGITEESLGIGQDDIEYILNCLKYDDEEHAVSYYNRLIREAEDWIRLDRKRLANLGNEKDRDYLEKKYKERIEREQKNIETYEKGKTAIGQIKGILQDKGYDNFDIKAKHEYGHLFEWFTNLNEDNTLDVDKPLSEQGEGVRKAIFEYYKSRPDDYITPKNIDDLNKYQDGGRFYKDVIFQMRREGASNPKLEASKLLAKLGIKGLTYVGRQDGRCYVSFEGGATIKLQDPFTFDDNGNLIPLTERFDEGNADMRFSIVTDEKKIKELESGEKMKVYRAMQLVDGKLYPPMSAKINGEWRDPIQLGKWEQAEENPELAKDGKFTLNKGNGSSISARYNPYFHTSSFPLNDQFASAYKRPELVVVEVEIPVSELTSGYKAEGAKDSVGKVEWKSGTITSKLGGRDVYLSRYDKPIRIVPEDEIAEIVAQRVNGKNIVFDSRLVTPSLKEALLKKGIKFDNADMRFSVVDEQIETPQFKAWFGNSKVVDENGKPLHVYHGTSRGDRVGDIFDPKRSTSGPMAFFTDNKDIATNYSTGKLDTSVEKEGLLDSFDNRFVFTLETGRKVPFTKAWGFIPFAKRREIIEKAKHITLDDEAENIIYDENANNGLGQFSYHLKYARDNAFKALVDEWLESGTLMREDEVRFLQVLKLVGVENVEFLDPYKQDPKVYDVFLRIENPFDTSNIKKTDITGLKRSAKKAQKNYNPDEATNVDMWDKSAISPEEWIEKFESDLDSGKTYAWTQIPDFVSDYLKSKGYDGIKDSGGKFTDVGHTVWIPFNSSQIKDATGENSGDFSLDNPSIRFSIIGEKGAGNLQDGVALEKLKEAINLENKNTNPTDIWRSTGWERSPIDDKWRFEIPYGNLKKSGTASKFPYNTKKEYTLAEVWDAPVLYDAYPELKNIKVKFYKDAHSNVGGSTLHSQKLIKVNLSLHRENIFGEWYCSDVKLKNTFIHEIQHFIQHIEGFAKGGSVYSIRRTLAELRNPNEFPVLQKAYEEAYQKYLDFLKQFNWDGVGDMPDDVAIEINSNPQLEREYKRLVSNVNSSYSVGESFVRSNIKDDPYNVYNRLGGEVEARNASERSTMTEEERRYKNPSLTADVDIGSQIFLFKDESGAEPIIRFRDYESGENYNVGNELFGTGDMRFSVADTKPERLKKLRESKPIVINSKNIKIRIGADLKTRKKDAYKIGMSLRGTYYNKDTGDKIEVVEKSISEFLRHDVDFESKEDIVNVSFAHLLSVSKIPEIIENSIYINSVPNEDPKNYGKIDTFDYYFVGLKIDRKDYTAKVVVAKNSNGQKYYDHALSKIEKGKLLWHLIKSLRRGSDTSRNLPYGIRDKRIFSLLQENNQPDADFSYTDNDILQKKRELSVDLAKKIYNRISKDIDFDLQNKEHRKLLRPTEDDRDFVFNADLSMLDDDVDFVLDRAEAILWKLINGSPKKSLQNDFDRYAVSAERDIENSRIFDAVIKDALNEFKKESKLQAKLKAQIQKDAEKQANAVVGYNLDELAVNGVDLLDTIANANEDDITNAIEQIFAFCDDWANSEGLSFDMAFAKKRATLVSCFDDIANQLTYGRHFKSAVRAIEKLRSIEKESVLKNQSIRLAKRFAEYLIEQTQELEKIKLETQELEEKAKQKKEKEKLEREAKLLEKKRQRAIKLFKSFALGQKLPVANKLDIKRPLPAKVQAYLAQIKKVIGKSADEVAERYQFLQQKALDRNSENKPIDFRERYEMSALMIYGNIAEKSLAEILFAYDELKQLIAGEKDKQFERQEKLEAQVAETAEPLVKALKLAGYNKGKSGGGFSFVSREISMFEHGLRNIFLTKKGMSDELRQQVENWVVETARQVGRSALGERRFHEDEMIWLKNILAKCYGDAEKGFARLTHIDDKLAKFSSVAGRPMSIGQIMQIVCTLEQWQVKEAIKQVEKKYLNKDADLSDEDLRRYHYWKFLKENDANMRSFLSESDLSFIQALKMRYADRYNKINPLYEELNGVPMIANGSNYIPIVREGDYTLGETKRVVAVFPAYYTPRTISLKEIDEDANILHIFINRTREDAHFLNFAKLTFMSQELTANYDFNQAIKLNMSDNERAWFNDMMTDVLTGKIAHSDSANKKLVSFFSKVSAYAGLMYNLTSAVKQVSALPAFLLQVDSKEFVNGLKLAIENGEFWTAMREFLGSDYMQDRYRSGEVNQILAEITKAEKDNNVGDSGWKRFRRMFVKFGFMPISAMDWLSHALCGTMLYYSTYKKYAELYPEDEAKRLAIMDTCSVGEMTQQSAMIHNLGETQRSGESLMKMFTQFRTANRQYMSYEINALGEFISNPSWARFRRAGKTVVLNHLVLPALFNGIGLFMDALLGDDIDDDDWEYFWKSTALKCFLDVFTGWYISAFFGEAIKIAFLNQYGKSSDTMMSSTAFFRIVDTCVFAMRDLTKNGLDDFDLWEHLDKLGRASFAPYRLVRKAYKNATDNKEGSIW